VVSHLRRKAKHGCGRVAGGGPREGLNEYESEVKVVGAAADHPGDTLGQDARLDGERSSDYKRRDKEREGEGRGWMTDTHIHLTPFNNSNLIIE